MKMCCKDMAMLLNSDFVRIGHPFADSLEGFDLSGVYVEARSDDWLLMRFCPFCGRNLLVDFEGRSDP